MFSLSYCAIAALLLGLAATLVLAAHLTPARWWKRPNLLALLVLLGGTWAVGTLMLPILETVVETVAGVPRAHAATPAMARAVSSSTPVPVPVAGRTYIAYQDVNLRSDSTVSARRIGVVPGGALVTLTGAHQGDWWQVTALLAGQRRVGWASSLWLRRPEEGFKPRS